MKRSTISSFGLFIAILGFAFLAVSLILVATFFQYATQADTSLLFGLMLIVIGIVVMVAVRGPTPVGVSGDSDDQYDWEDLWESSDGGVATPPGASSPRPPPVV